MNKEALKQVLDAMKLHTAETHPLVETERAMEMIEAELAQEPVRREQRLFMDEQAFYKSPTQRQPLTDAMVQESKMLDYYNERGIFIDGWLKAEAAHDIKGQP